MFRRIVHERLSALCLNKSRLRQKFRLFPSLRAFVLRPVFVYAGIAKNARLPLSRHYQLQVTTNGVGLSLSKPFSHAKIAIFNSACRLKILVRKTRRLLTIYNKLPLTISKCITIETGRFTNRSVAPTEPFKY